MHWCAQVSNMADPGLITEEKPGQFNTVPDLLTPARPPLQLLARLWREGVRGEGREQADEHF